LLVYSAVRDEKKGIKGGISVKKKSVCSCRWGYLPQDLDFA
jgi:hypothetical protein